MKFKYLMVILTALSLQLRTNVWADTVSTNDEALVYFGEDIVRQMELMNTIGQGHKDPRAMVDRVSARRQALIKELVAIFNAPESSVVSRNLAAHFLGELRATEAVDSLVANLGSSWTFNPKPILLSDETPVKNALIKIGSPAIPAIIHKLAETDESTEFIKGYTFGDCVYALTSIDQDRDVTVLRLQKALKMEADPQKQARLQRAINTFQAKASDAHK